MKASAGKLDRAAGAMVGLACGDALGAPYEFGGPYPSTMPVEMTGGGALGWAPGEWTDDTAMAAPLLELAASGERMRNLYLGPIVRAWVGWAESAKDVGTQTSVVLGAVRGAVRREPFEQIRFGYYDGEDGALVERSNRAAAELHRRWERSAGNGSLMRTAPVGLRAAHSEAEDVMAEYARQQSALTHADPDAQDACALWSLAIGHAIRTGKLDLRIGLDMFEGILPPRDSGRARVWEERIREAEMKTPDEFTRNGWVVEAFQGAWSAIMHSGDRSENDPRHVRRALELAVRGGNDTDTVAAIAGSLVGAAYGVSAIPLEWKRRIHGWPGWRADDLIERAIITVSPLTSNLGEWPRAERLEYEGWTHRDTCVPHPHDPGVYLGSIGALDRLPAEVDAVVSLCRIGKDQVPDRIAPENQVRVWLVDSEDGKDNAHLDFVLREAADMVARLRVEGRTVLLHCVQSYSRTPTVGALYAALYRGVEPDRAIKEVADVLPIANPNPRFRKAVARIAEASLD